MIRFRLLDTGRWFWCVANIAQGKGIGIAPTRESAFTAALAARKLVAS